MSNASALSVLVPRMVMLRRTGDHQWIDDLNRVPGLHERFAQVSARRKWWTLKSLVLKRDGELAEIVKGRQDAQPMHLTFCQKIYIREMGKSIPEKGALYEGLGARCHIGAMMHQWVPFDRTSGVVGPHLSPKAGGIAISHGSDPP